MRQARVRVLGRVLEYLKRHRQLVSFAVGRNQRPDALALWEAFVLFDLLQLTKRRLEIAFGARDADATIWGVVVVDGRVGALA